MQSVREDLVATNAEKPLGVPLDPHMVRGLERFVGFTSLFSVAVGMLGLGGWIFHIAAFKSVIPGRVVIPVVGRARDVGRIEAGPEDLLLARPPLLTCAIAATILTTKARSTCSPPAKSAPRHETSLSTSGFHCLEA